LTPSGACGADDQFVELAVGDGAVHGVAVEGEACSRSATGSSIMGVEAVGGDLKDAWPGCFDHAGRP
jgi:NifU-like protein involved in Fe-S cluster formation